MTKTRIQSIDLLRGLVMIIMTLDHTRDYFHYDAFFFDPSDLSQTNIALFFTRFVTHFCAPVFVFLAGTSAYFVGKRMDKKKLSIRLLKRGFWLIFLELVVIKFAWNFKLDYSIITLQVIWALGLCMILLAGFIHLPKSIALGFSLILIAGHNMFDSFHPESNRFLEILWSFLHVFGIITFDKFMVFVAYPLIPWIGLMVFGYYFGEWYSSDFKKEKRMKSLLITGSALILLFVLLRAGNLYGDPFPWEAQSKPIFSFLSFINIMKYPPSLLYILLTIGPTLIFLWLAEKFSFDKFKPLVVIGRVPMFWYILHIYIIHLFAAIAASATTGFVFSDMLIDLWVTRQPELKGYGFSLGFVYLVWITVILILYPMSNWYNNYKTTNKDKWWLSYL